MKYCLFAALLFATPALAQTPYPWEGTWAYDLATCDDTAQNEGETAPYTLTASQVHSTVQDCDIKNVAQVPNLDAWSYVMSCAIDGEVVDENHLIMMESKDAQWTWFGSDEPLRFQRCPAQ